MQIEINRWKHCDIKQIADIEKSTFKQPWSYEMLNEEFGNQFYDCLVAKAKGDLVGYVGYHIIASEYHITNIAIKESFRRQGISKLLMSKLSQNAQANFVTGITLEVRASNLAAINLYTNFGFTIKGCRKKYYEGQEDALIMWKYF